MLPSKITFQFRKLPKKTQESYQDRNATFRVSSYLQTQSSISSDTCSLSTKFHIYTKILLWSLIPSPSQRVPHLLLARYELLPLTTRTPLIFWPKSHILSNFHLSKQNMPPLTTIILIYWLHSSSKHLFLWPEDSLFFRKY